MGRHVVAVVGEIPPGGRKIVDVENRSIGVFNVDGEYFAIRNVCPHAGAPLCEGSLVGAVTAKLPGQHVYERPGEFVRCPWHHWEFDLRTGQSWFDPVKTRVRSYDVAVVAGSPEDMDAEPGSGRQPGPYTVESYSTTREGDLIVVDTGRPEREARAAD
jgi:3-phenylpropionate/trans-cinnamate dioxygenase ferredoxin subunit